MSDHSRIESLRLRVQNDPASIAFAQLAEEYRRAGQYEDSVEVCRDGLERHPGYLSARVTLGRALLELGQLEQAQEELEHVLRHAPENLTATRCLALVHERQGATDSALARYRAALELAPNDPDLEWRIEELTDSRLGTHAGPVETAPALEFVTPAAATPLGPVLGAEELQYDRLAGDTVDVARVRGLATVTVLEQWLAAIHVTRAQRHA